MRAPIAVAELVADEKIAGVRVGDSQRATQPGTSAPRLPGSKARIPSSALRRRTSACVRPGPWLSARPRGAGCPPMRPGRSGLPPPAAARKRAPASGTRQRWRRARLARCRGSIGYCEMRFPLFSPWQPPAGGPPAFWPAIYRLRQVPGQDAATHCPRSRSWRTCHCPSPVNTLVPWKNSAAPGRRRGAKPDPAAGSPVDLYGGLTAGAAAAGALPLVPVRQPPVALRPGVLLGTGYNVKRVYTQRLHPLRL